MWPVAASEGLVRGAYTGVLVIESVVNTLATINDEGASYTETGSLLFFRSNEGDVRHTGLSIPLRSIEFGCKCVIQKRPLNQ